MRKACLAVVTLSTVLAGSSAWAQGEPPPYPPPAPPPPAAPPPQGLAPPPPIASTAPGSPTAPPPGAATTAKLDEAEAKDSKRGMEYFYVNAEGGFAYYALGALSSDASFVRTNHAGAMVGASAGFRLLFFTLGGRFRYNMQSAFNLWQVNAVAGFHVNAGNWDPYVAIHGGYSAVGNLDGSNVAGSFLSGSTPADMDVHGFNIGLSGGIDYYLAGFLSLGIDGTFEFLALKRPPLPCPAGVPAAVCADAAATNPLYANSGNTAGVGLVASAHLALHL
jgi:hypothetical protein